MASLGGTAHGRVGRVRWRRFAITLIPAFALAVLLMLLSTEAVLAVSFSISGEPFIVTASLLKGYGFEQFPVVDHSVVNDLPGHSNQVSLEATAIREARITNLCQSVRIGPISMVIKAGGGGTPVSATDLVVDADRFSGRKAKFTHLSQGEDASELDQVPGVRGPAGAFALQAATVTITDLRQHAYATTAGTFTLPGFSLQLGGSC
jgi:Family of unknown function (DUF6230)